jgi:glycosyltransferase involved in cell wall biosynthesis
MKRKRRPLRVLVVAPGHAVGGQANAARDITRGFAGHAAVRVSFQPIDPPLPGRLRFLTEWKFIRSVVRPLRYCRGLLRAIPQADVLHVFAAAHTAFLFGALPALIIARWFRRPVILNYHDGRAEAHFRWWGGGALLRWAARRAAMLVFPSAYLQEVFRRHGFDGVVVPNVVDVSAFTYRHPEPIRPRLISARQLEGLYAVENTLRAFALLQAQIPDAVLDVYGGGTAARELRRIAAKLGTPGVRFHGEVPHTRMAAVFADGGILVNSSRIDNMPLVIIEAFAAGVPVVTTAAGGIPHLVAHERTGMLVPVDRPAALAAAVRRVLEEPGLAAGLASAARAECARYSWAEAERGWVAAYRRVAAEGSVAERPHPRSYESLRPLGR